MHARNAPAMDDVGQLAASAYVRYMDSAYRERHPFGQARGDMAPRAQSTRGGDTAAMVAADHAFAYARIAAEIERHVSHGSLRPGDRLPSVRQMASHWAVSIPTVVQAYRVLEARRLVQARPKSGHYILARPSGARAVARETRPHPAVADVTTGDAIVGFLERVMDPALVPLGTALPDASLLPTARLARALASVARRDGVRSAMLASPSGTEELRTEVARRSLSTRAGVSRDDIVITAGCAEAIALALRAVAEPGDTVIVESPAYFGTLQAMEALQLRALEVPTDPHEGIDVEALDHALRHERVKAVVLAPTVHNPLGYVMSDARKRLLAAVLDRYEIPLIEDETYAELHYASERPASLRAFVRRTPVLSCGSFSKTLAPAYRIGWIVPGPYHPTIVRLKAATSVATAVPTQLAIAEFLRTGGYDHHLRKLRATLHGNVQRITSAVAHRLPAGSQMSAPSGGFLLWAKLPERVDSMVLYRRCLTRGVSIAPGTMFSATGVTRHCLRLNAGLLWSGRIVRAIETIAEEATRLATKR